MMIKRKNRSVRLLKSQDPNFVLIQQHSSRNSTHNSTKPDDQILIHSYQDIIEVRKRPQDVNTEIRKSDQYPGLALNLSNCSKIKRMHACLSGIALKASESSYILETFSSDISCDKKHGVTRSPRSSLIFSTRKHKYIKLIFLAHLRNCVFAESLKSFQKILIGCSKKILSNIQSDIN